MKKHRHGTKPATVLFPGDCLHYTPAQLKVNKAAVNSPMPQFAPVRMKNFYFINRKPPICNLAKQAKAFFLYVPKAGLKYGYPLVCNGSKF